MQSFLWPITAWLKYGLALCLVCNALLCAAHDLAAPLHGSVQTAAASADEASAGQAVAVASAADDAVTAPSHCGHAELHHVGLTSSGVPMARAIHRVHVAAPLSLYTSLAHQPPVTPPIA